MSKVTFNNNNNHFFLSLKSSIDEYFIKTKKSKTGDFRLYLKSFLLVGSAIAIYYCLMFISPNIFTAVILAALFGFLNACIGFSVMHDANHGSYSNNHLLNDAIGMIGSNGLGANAFFGNKNTTSFITPIPISMALMTTLLRALLFVNAKHKNGFPLIKFNIYTCLLYIPSLLFFGFL